MNKKSMLLILPALMVLSSCSTFNGKTIKNGYDSIKEDNLAHEEIFGTVKDFQPMRLGDFEETTEAGSGFTIAPKIGIQFYSYNKDATDYYAVRYVAAIAGLEGITASWTRGISQKDSTQVRTLSSDHESTVPYTSLNNGGVSKSATEEGTGYNKYVVYTMYDIPTTEEKSYIAAYLTLSNGVAEPVKSKVVIAQINGGHAFGVSLDDADGKYFLEGKIGGVNKIVYEDVSPLRDNNASFTDVTFSLGDKYGMFQLDTSSNTFKFYGNETFYSTSASAYVNEASGIDEYNSPIVAGSYTLFANEYNLVYIIDVKTYTVTGLPDWTGNSCELFAWAWDEHDKGSWKSASFDGSDLTFRAEKDIEGFLLVRCYVGTTTPNWDEHGDAVGRIYNKTGDVYTTSGTYSYAKYKDSDDSISWLNY